MSDKATQKGLRDQLGDGYLNLLDSVRHSFEQAAWGQETTGDLSADFYKWAGADQASPQPMQAGLGEGVQAAGPGEGSEIGASGQEASGKTWEAFEAWIEGKIDARIEPERGMEQERSGPELGE